MMIDLNGKTALGRILDAVRTGLRDPDILIKDAATVAPLGATSQLDPADVTNALALNVIAPVVLASRVIPAMIEHGLWFATYSSIPRTTPKTTLPRSRAQSDPKVSIKATSTRKGSLGILLGAPRIDLKPLFFGTHQQSLNQLEFSDLQRSLVPIIDEELALV